MVWYALPYRALNMYCARARRLLIPSRRTQNDSQIDIMQNSSHYILTRRALCLQQYH